MKKNQISENMRFIFIILPNRSFSLAKKHGFYYHEIHKAN